MASNGKTETTIAMEDILCDQFISNYYCLLHREVDFNYGKERCDLCGFMQQNRQLVCIELKQSVSDFHSNAKLTFKGVKNYYAMPYDIYLKVKNEIPKEVGVFTLPRDYILKRKCHMGIIKKAKTNQNGMYAYFYQYDVVKNKNIIDLFWNMQNSIKSYGGILGKSLSELNIHSLYSVACKDEMLLKWCEETKTLNKSDINIIRKYKQNYGESEEHNG